VGVGGKSRACKPCTGVFWSSITPSVHCPAHHHPWTDLVPVVIAWEFETTAVFAIRVVSHRSIFAIKAEVGEGSLRHAIRHGRAVCKGRILASHLGWHRNVGVRAFVTNSGEAVSEIPRHSIEIVILLWPVLAVFWRPPVGPPPARHDMVG